MREMTMVERVARAIRVAQNQKGLISSYDLAVAAIEAMREPTPEMLRDAWDIGGLDTEHGITQTEKQAHSVWQAMIDAALGDAP